MKTCLRITGISVLIAAAMFGQGPDGRRGFQVRGELSPLPPGSGILTVELSTNESGGIESAVVNPDGSFEFRSAQPGAHELRVMSTGGMVLHQETVLISSVNQPISIRLPQSSSPSPSPANSTISAQQLGHKVPVLARKAYDKAEQAEAKGEHEQAIELFREAVSIDPEFADGFNELGAVEAATGDLQRAIEDFQKAVDVAPDHRLALANLSIVLAKTQRFDEAVLVARRALRVMPNSGTMRYVLATSLLFASGDSDEVLDNLERATSEIPLAHLLSAELLVRRGKRDEAIRHVEEYLKVVPPDDKERNRAETMLIELKKQ
jgi:tetratricopeptide (TPR) repeat protein